MLQAELNAIDGIATLRPGGALSKEDFTRAEKAGSHFVSAEIRHFAYDEKAEALAWITAPAA